MKIIGTTEISHEIEHIIESASEFMIIVSPYLKITKRLRVKLDECFDRCESSTIVYRENELAPKEMSWLQSHQNLDLIPVENLHAKCYLNEELALLTSMNLYEYSQINNHELGALITREESENYLQLLKELNHIVKSEHNGKDFEHYVDVYSDFSMGALYVELISKYRFQEVAAIMDGAYLLICEVARTMINFSAHELYQDETAVLRSTKLGKEDYHKVFKRVAKQGVKIRQKAL